MRHFTKFLNLALLITAFATLSNAFAEIPRLTEINSGIFRGGQPKTHADYELLAAMGIKTILNLREDATVEQEQFVAEQMGFDFVNVPLNGFKYPDSKDIDQALELIVNPAAQPVFMHCKHGKDRTGLIAAMYRVKYENWAPVTAYKEWQELDFNAWLIGLNLYFWFHTAR